MGPWLLPILIGVGAIFFLKGRGTSTGISLFSGVTPPLAGGVPNYPPSTPDSVSTGIAGAIASAFKPPLTEIQRAMPPTLDTGPMLPTAPPVIDQMPVPAFMGGADWEPSVLAAGGTEADYAAMVVSAAMIPPSAGAAVIPRRGVGHF